MTNGLSTEATPAGFIGRTVRFLFPLILDVGIVLASYTLALSLKFDGDVPDESWRQLFWAGPLIAFAYILAYQFLGVYRTAWQYGSVRDALLLAGAVAVVTAGILTVNFLLPKRPIPLTVNVISAAFIFLFHAMARMLPRLWAGASFAASDARPQERVLIVGAGETGGFLARELRSNRGQPYRPVAFIDDNPGLRGKRVHGVPVVGGRNDIPDAIAKQRITLVALALPPTVAPGLQELLALIEPSKVPVRLVPSVHDVMEGRARAAEMREITVEDLLAREPLPVDIDACRATIRDKVVLITGAAGSIGSELTRRIAALEPAAVHLLDTNETALHELRLELLGKVASTCPVKPWLCTIVNRQKVLDIFEATHPQVVFHLAAFKLVPMMEEHPDQAFENNVLGTLNVFEAAQEVESEHVVFLSSHTAVNPTSVYGASKRIGELLVTSMTKRTRFCAIRLTNVIDAAGTVLGVFSRQIQKGEPILVTHPEMARYFLTINEVAGLTVQAAALSSGGEVFLLDVGDEVRIHDLAQRVMSSMGREVPIEFGEPRPGEKLRENLIGENERLVPTSHPKVMTAVSSLRFSGAELRAGIRELEVDLRRRTGNLPARLHALARLDRSDGVVEEVALQAPPREA